MPLLPSMASTGACWHRQTPALERATICSEAVVDAHESADTITNWRDEGCRLDNASAVEMSQCAPGVKATSRVARRVAVAGALTGVAPTRVLGTVAATSAKIAERTTRRSIRGSLRAPS